MIAPSVLSLTLRAPTPPVGQPTPSSPKIRRHRTLSASTATSSDSHISTDHKERWSPLRNNLGVLDATNIGSTPLSPTLYSGSSAVDDIKHRNSYDGTLHPDGKTVYIDRNPSPSSPGKSSNPPVMKPVPPPKPPEVRSLRSESARKRLHTPPAILPKPASLSSEKLTEK
ncbi:hypothetical protein BC829DRAFT_20728 [Chytridium lagenaria]|nr:hypothetical protein BC829DRAFT_20728 [Chytridium lagenaria]